MADRYVMFTETQIGRDGTRYIGNVKYKISLETHDKIHIIGKNGFLNWFKKSKIKNKCIIGDIFIS